MQLQREGHSVPQIASSLGRTYRSVSSWICVHRSEYGCFHADDDSVEASENAKSPLAPSEVE